LTIIKKGLPANWWNAKSKLTPPSA